MTIIKAQFEVEVPEDVSPDQIEEAVRVVLSNPLHLEGEGGMIFNWADQLFFTIVDSN